MSYTVTKFVLDLRGLTPSEKAVAHSLAYHAHANGTEAYPSMTTIAAEAGLADRRCAQRIVRQLEKKGVIAADTPKTGGRTSTHYHFIMGTCDLGVAPNGDGPATLDDGTRDLAVTPPETLDVRTSDLGVARKVIKDQGKERERKVSDGGNGNGSNSVSSLSPFLETKSKPTPSQEEIDEACSRLYLIGKAVNKCQPTFYGTCRAAIGQLLTTYSAGELCEGYAQFVQGRDDFEMRQAPKRFVEGGAHDVLGPIRKRKRERQELEMKWRAAEIEDHRRQVEQQMLVEQEERGKDEPLDSPIRQRYDLNLKYGSLPATYWNELEPFHKLRAEAARQPEFQAALQARVEGFDPGPCSLPDNFLRQRITELTHSTTT